MTAPGKITASQEALLVVTTYQAYIAIFLKNIKLQENESDPLSSRFTTFQP
jgi:hypothetical protein